MITKEFIDANSFNAEHMPESRIIRQLYEMADVYNWCEAKADHLATALASESADVYSYVLELQDCLDDVFEKVKMLSQNSFSPLAQLSVNALNVVLGDIEAFCRDLEDIEKSGSTNIEDCTLGYTLHTIYCLLDDKKSEKMPSVTLEEFLALDEDPDTMLSFEDFLVRTNVFRCDKNHTIETINATVNVMKANGEITKHSVPAGYCNCCNVYFILERDYAKLRKLGSILCQQITYETYVSRGSSLMNGTELKPESVLHQCGYNVSATENLSREQRRGILRMVVDCDIYSVSGLCSHLDWLIERNRHSAKKDMSNAIAKWQDDRDYIAAYKPENRRNVGIRSIKKNNFY